MFISFSRTINFDLMFLKGIRLKTNGNFFIVYFKQNSKKNFPEDAIDMYVMNAKGMGSRSIVTG